MPAMSGVGRITGFTGHPKAEQKSGLAVGVDHGKALTKRSLKPKQSYAKGKLQKRVKFVREIVREVVGFAPFEKRALKVCKNKLGSHKRAKAKREELAEANRQMR